MKRLVCSDLHLTDHPNDEYRWNVFEDIINARPDELYILGDTCDAADHHSAELVNRIVDTLKQFTRQAIPITILCGNHDTPLRGKPFWSFLSDMPHITFVTKPMANQRLLLLPHSRNPQEEWKGIDFTLYQCIMMHYTADGVDTGNGHRLSVPNQVIFPPGPVLLSGDIHVPQVVQGITYVGSPHPKNYGEQHIFRMLELDENYQIAHEINLYPPLKHDLVVYQVADLYEAYARSGDAAQIEYILPADQMKYWPTLQLEIKEWAQSTGVRIHSLRATPRYSNLQQTAAMSQGYIPDTSHVFFSFCDQEALDDPLIETGYAMLDDILRRHPEYRNT